MLRLAVTFFILCVVGSPQRVFAQSHFTGCEHLTGNNATILVPSGASITIDGEALSTDSELAVFTQDGLCAGIVVWKNQSTGFAVWGDDTQTAAEDGFSAGEPLIHRIWDASTGIEYDGTDGAIAVTFSDAESFYTADNSYFENAIYELTSLSVETSLTMLATPALSSPADGAVDQPWELELAWTSVDGASGYQVQVALDADFTSLVLAVDTLTVPAATVHLDEPTTYYWRVRAAHESGAGAWSSAWSFTTLSELPPAPELVSPADGTTDAKKTLLFTWTTSPTASTYSFQLARDDAFTEDVFEAHDLDATELRVNSLTPGTTYYWRARAWNAAGSGAWSITFSFTTAAPRGQHLSLTAPSNGETIAETSTRFAWAPSAGATYIFQLATDATFSDVIVERADLDTTQLEIGGLERGRRYVWRVGAVGADGQPGWSSAFSVTIRGMLPASAPAQVAPANFAQISPGLATLSWDAVEHAASYRVQLFRSGYQSWVLVDDSSGISEPEMSFRLEPGTRYGWLVQAVNESGSTEWSPMRTFTTSMATNSEDAHTPHTFALHPNYPNPFNPSTTISYDLPESARVRITIYNAAGRQVDELHNATMPPGSHSIQWEAGSAPSGTYFCRIEAGGEMRMQTLVLLK